MPLSHCRSHHPRMPWVTCESAHASNAEHLGRGGWPSRWHTWRDDDPDTLQTIRGGFRCTRDDCPMPGLILPDEVPDHQRMHPVVTP